ncbi:MAG: serine/threonine protein kinase, partial [Myxococcales bacterium]|nr:serine/threonine protein kinase [Myxococcales bacterium]
MPPTSDRPPDPLIGQVVDDRYRIIRAIGRGGMGLIYEAQATRLGGRLCAVKVLLPEFAASGTAAARFAREAEVAARVKHPNVIDIFDTGTAASGLRYIAMELLTGEGLDRTLRRGPLPWPRAQHITLQICRALAAAHAAQVVHRDMKPENCFRVTREDDDDFIKVLDFGIAKLIDTEDRDEDSRLTSTGSVIGTYAYMSIEQIDGEPIDHRTDIWAVGVILHELLTGQLPFRGKNQGQVWKAIHEHDLLPMRNLAPQMHIPAPAEAIVAQALARSLSERYPTIDALARAVASVQADGSLRAVTGKLGLPPRAPPPPPPPPPGAPPPPGPPPPRPPPPPPRGRAAQRRAGRGSSPQGRGAPP